MGRKTRIVLLSVTTVLAVVTFIAMLAVRPGTESQVLEAARERQQEPLLSVSEPLETDVKTLSDEERMAEKVRELLLSDEAFIASLSSSIESIVPEYVTEWVESDEAAAILDDLQERGVSEAVSRIVTEENINEIAAVVASKLGTDDAGVYKDATDRVVSIIAGSLVIPELQKKAVEEAVNAFYADNSDRIASDVIRTAVEEYSALTAEEKTALLDLVSVYDENREAIINDIISMLPEDEEIDAEKIAAELYDKYRDQVAEDVIAYYIDHYGQPQPAAEAEAEEVPAPEPELSPTLPAKEAITAPVFSSEPAVAPGASQDDYNRARESMRAKELERLSAFIN